MNDFTLRRDVNERLEMHDKIALAFSGGKDSLACVFLARGYFERITLYHVDTGDYLPEQLAVIKDVEENFPYKFVRIQTDVSAWIDAHGLPSDLIPFTQHPYGHAAGYSKTRLVHRFDCCHYNMMLPLYERVVADGCTMLIRGTKACDMPFLPFPDGHVDENGIELYHPIEAWSDVSVLAYLHLSGATISPIYAHLDHGLSCATCSAWLNEKRGRYLRRYHPELYRKYDARLQAITDEVAPSLALLKHELEV